jgi:hypothetical protein
MDEPLKSYSPEIERRNLYFIETSEKFSRLVVQIKEENVLEDLMVSFIAEIEEIEILLKVVNKKCENKNDDIWNRYYGKTSKKNILNGLKQHHRFIFYDGYNEILIKNSFTNEYICLDEYGCLFYYLNSFEKIIKKLSEINVKEVFDNNGFIPTHFCYRRELSNQEELLTNFIKEFKLEFVEKNEE